MVHLSFGLWLVKRARLARKCLGVPGVSLGAQWGRRTWAQALVYRLCPRVCSR